MVVTLIEWEKLGNGKWKKKHLYVTGSVHTKRKINPNSPDYAKKLQRTMEKIFIYCEECKKKYCLANPCIHHLSDSEAHTAKYKELRKKERESLNQEEEKKSSQTLILNKEVG